MISFATFQLFLIKFMTYFGKEKKRDSLIILLSHSSKKYQIYFSAIFLSAKG